MIMTHHVNLNFFLPVAFSFLLFMISGCGMTTSFNAGVSSNEYSLALQTTDQSHFLFHRGKWTLDLKGVSGTADRVDDNGTMTRTDTTVSYTNIASATSPAGGSRGNTMEQFLLTILGVILVIGLAGLMLYAAFRATER